MSRILIPIHPAATSPPAPTTEADARFAGWADDIGAGSAAECWLVARAAAASAEIERLERAEAEESANLAARAGLAFAWEADRKAEAGALAARLHAQPVKAAGALRRTLHGAAWMLDRWHYLLESLEEGDHWTDGQRSLALDLLGVPPAERDGPTELDPPPKSGRDRLAVRRGVAGREVEALLAAVKGPLAHLDAMDRRRATLSLGIGPGAGPGSTLAAIRRRLVAANRHLRWALDTLRKSRRDRAESLARDLDDEAPEAPLDREPERESDDLDNLIGPASRPSSRAERANLVARLLEPAPRLDLSDTNLAGSSPARPARRA